MMGIELAAKIPAFAAGEKSPVVQFINRLHEAGALAVPSGTHVIRILPALNLRPEEAAEGIAHNRIGGGEDIPMKHLLSLEKLARSDMEGILAASAAMKKERGHHAAQPLRGQTWALMFSKSSTRTRVSFEVGIRELGGQVMFLSAAEIQLGRGEPIKDTARVLGRMIHGAVIRTYAQKDVEEFAEYSGIPTVNALTDEEHPCQILADIFTFQEKRGADPGQGGGVHRGRGLQCAGVLDFCGGEAGFELRVASPKKYQPGAEILRRAGGKVVLHGRRAGGGAGRGFALHGCVGFDGEGGGGGGAFAGTGGLPNQRERGEAGPAGRAGDALPAGLSREGN